MTLKCRLAVATTSGPWLRTSITFGKCTRTQRKRTPAILCLHIPPACGSVLTQHCSASMRPWACPWDQIIFHTVLSSHVPQLSVPLTWRAVGLSPGGHVDRVPKATKAAPYLADDASRGRPRMDACAKQQHDEPCFRAALLADLFKYCMSAGALTSSPHSACQGMNVSWQTAEESRKLAHLS